MLSSVALWSTASTTPWTRSRWYVHDDARRRSRRPCGRAPRAWRPAEPGGPVCPP